MKKIFILLNIIMIAVTLACCVYYHEHGGLLMKGTTSSCFVVVGLVNLVYAVKSKLSAMKFPVLMAVGLLVSMIGDVALNIDFITGALIFAAGHLFYFAAYCVLMKFRAKDLIPTAAIFVMSVMIIKLVPMFDFGSALMEGICIFYSLVISCMCGKAVSNFLREKSLITGLLLVGSVLFYFSDLMLCLGKFGGAPDIVDTLCLFTYFPAQCLLGHTVFHHVNNEKSR